MSIGQRTIHRISQITAVPEKEITPETELVSGLGCDSLDIIELTMALEEEFGIRIDDEVAEKLVTVQQVIEHVGGLVKEVQA